MKAKLIFTSLLLFVLGLYGCKENEPFNKPSKMIIEGVPEVMFVGAEVQLTIKYDTDYEGKPEWSTENADIASVDENGKLTAISAGETRVVAKCYDLVATVPITVRKDTILILNDTITLYEGETKKVSAILGSYRNVSIEWFTTNPDIFTVDEIGVSNSSDLILYHHCYISAKNIGEAYIIASFEDIIDSSLVVVNALSGIENGRNWVDMGLSVKWATMNVGANSIPEDGICVAWGETEPKYAYNWETYKWCVSGPYISGGVYYDTYLSKYQLDDNFGPYYRIDTIRTQDGDFIKEEYVKVFIGDGKSVLDPEDDAAHVKWGGNWRMPTYEECEELIENCTWEEVLYGDVYGYKATSKITNQWLFFPAARHKDGYESVGVRHGQYWSSKSTLNAHAAYLSLINGRYEVSSYYSAVGCYVRGVVE